VILRWVPAPLIVFLAAVATYANTLWGGFVFDDLQNIVQNRWIKDPGFVSEIFGSHMGGFDPEFSTWYYRPLIHAAHMIVYQIAGLRPAAFHLVNILLHATISLLVYLVTRELFRRSSSAPSVHAFACVVVGLLFATHPIHSESVAWVSGISDLLYTLFVLWSFLFYMRGEQDSKASYTLAGVLFFAAALCKEPALMLLPLVLVYEAAFPRFRGTGMRPGAMARWLPLAVATGAYLVLRTNALGGVAPSPRSSSYGPLASILSALDLFGRYLYKLVLPTHLSAIHVFRPVESLFDTRAFVGLAVSSGLAIAAWRMRRHPVGIIGLAFTVLPLLPTLYIPALGEGAFYERYLYLPVLGFGILLVLAYQTLIERWPAVRRGVGALLAFLVLVYAGGAVNRNRVWRDSLSL